ncbi:ATP-dependent helicase [Candidatus Woesebacteria bacterium]|nr:ATP-dependent helicase [Candidatus Woesebacteria bacterium]
MKQAHSVFQKEYARLNDGQKQAVDTIEGPVMVIAGPGTGKTQILTLRIANILLRTQVNSSNILALTFTQAAATNMRERLLKIIGNEAHVVNIFTFHAFCSNVIEQNPDDFWSLLGMKVADEIQKVQILESIIDANAFEHIKPFGKPYFYVSDALRSISDLKREGVNPQEFKAFIDQEKKDFTAIPDKESTRIAGSLRGEYQQQLKRIEKNAELQVLYAAYQKALQEHDIYDYDDLIMSVLERLRSNEDFRLRQMEKYQYILVDEHQDSNNAQNKIIQLLTSFHKNPNIFVVGDEKQAIFRFQGASVENFHKFTKQFPDAKLITLTENYRSTQTILDSAIQLLSAHDQTLNAQANHKEKPISVMIAETPHDEISAMVAHIQQDIQTGVSPDQIAVLTRKRAQMKVIAQVLAEANIPVFLDIDEDVFENATIQKLIVLLEAVQNYAQGEYIFPALHLDVFGVNPLDLYKLTQLVSRRRMELADVLSNKTKLQEYEIKGVENIHKIFTKFGEWYMLAKQEPLHTLIHTIVQESGLLQHMLKDANPILAVAPLREFYDNIQALDQQNTWKLDDLFIYFQKLKQHNIRIKLKIHSQSAGKVQLMTAHSAKGLEFDHVYIPHVQDTVWGGRKRAKLFTLPSAIYDLLSSEDTDADEKRLFFVALTRARHSLCLSYANTKSDGSVALASPYIADIRSELKHEVNVEPYAEVSLHTPLDQGKIVGEFSTFVQAAFEKYGISVSALNNYLKCPWRYFYTNLVRVPSGKDKTLMFGNAVHNAITYFYIHFKETGEKSADYLLEAFQKAAEKEMFTKAEMGDALVRGKQILTEYYRQYDEEFSRNVQVKVRIPEVRLPVGDIAGVDSIKLTGELDLVEYVDNSLTQVNVIDFKTGRPRSRNEILGKTKNADGNYYRQLIFYKLLLHYYKPNWIMKQGALDFIQPDGKGVFHKEAFEILSEEVVKLQEQVHEAAKDILALGFWDRFCDDVDCKWCELRKSLDTKVFEEGLF